MSEGGISVVDLEGTRAYERNPWRPSGELIQTEHPGRAWVISAEQEPRYNGARVYLVDATPGGPAGRIVLEADRIVHIREQVFLSPYDVHPRHVLEEDLEPHADLWVVFSRGGSDFLALLDADGEVRTVSSLKALGLEGGANMAAWQVIPVGKGPGAWFKTDRQLFFVDAGARLPGSGVLLTAEENIWVVPERSGTRAWVMAEVSSPAPSVPVARRLFSVDLEAPAKARSSLLLDGMGIRQVVAQDDGTRVWVAGALKPSAGWEGGLYLVDLQGRSMLAKVPLFKGQKVLVSRTPSGRVWALTHSGDAYLLDESGRILASGPKLLPRVDSDAVEALSTIPTASDDLLLWGNSVIHLRADHGSVRASPLLDGADVSSLNVDPVGEGVWLQSSRDGSLYFISLSDEAYLEEHFVLATADMAYVLPSAKKGHGWIKATPASFAYVPLQQVGAVLELERGTLEVENGQDVRVQGRLEVRASLHGTEVDSLDLDWPGRTYAAEVGGALEILILDPARPDEPVASAIRSYSPGAPQPRFNWALGELSLGKRRYTVIFKYQDEIGTRTELVVKDVPFLAPLSEQIWFRTAVACLVATLFFVVPLLVLPRTRLVRRWLPFMSWSVQVLVGSGFVFANVARQARIHFPAFVGVLFVEMLLCLILGAVSPQVFYLLSSAKPFQWLVPLALELPATRRRIFADYVAYVRRKLEALRRQANDEHFVSLPVDFREGRIHSLSSEGSKPTALPEESLLPPEERLVRFLSHPDDGQRGNALIESTGGRGKSALLREVVRLMLIGFEKEPSRPLPVLCDARLASLGDAALWPWESGPLTPDIIEVLLLRGDCVLCVDGLTESALSPEAVQEFIEGRYGSVVRLLLTSRPHPGFRQAVECSERWLIAEPQRLDEQALDRFIRAYAPGATHALSEGTRQACRGPDGTYLNILVRLAILLGEVAGTSIAALYEQSFRHLLGRQGTGPHEDDTELLTWAGELCLQTYWVQGLHTLRYRNAPARERMGMLLQAGVLVPDDPSVRPGQEPSQVRFFHDSMLSFLTARGLFMQEHASPTWGVFWRAAGEPLFANTWSDLVSGAGSELFQMCVQVFGPEERLRRELRRQLLEWASLYDDDLKKRDIVSAVPQRLQPSLQARLPSTVTLAPGRVLQVAIEVCEEELRDLSHLYMRMASLLWPLRQPEEEGDTVASQ
ncbi:hypothetical protein [Pyxidicoccus trucidator]|uniref:hypothetical protein n=1 Tax=Pyxidicoccus trucidator TaxID=2709662 RepID=UPI0013DC1925|nr:hypothetical protein [Pyxidicoccus trucidator]